MHVILIKPPRELIKALKDPDASIRRAAADRLGFLQEGQAVKPLCDALQDPDSIVRRTAADALGRIGVKTPAVIDALIARLDDPDASVRYCATYNLDTLGDPRAAETIVNAMEKFNHLELAGLIQHLSLDQEAVPKLVKALEVAIDQWKHTEREVNDGDALAHMYDPRKSVTDAFRRIRDPAATPTLVTMLKLMTDAEHYIKAARLAIENIGQPALPYLLAGLKDPDPWGRDQVLRALGLLGDIYGLDALIAEVGLANAAPLLRATLDPWMVRDAEPGTRSLKKMGWPAAQYFLELSKSRDASVRAAAVMIISHVRDRRATPYLLEILRTERDNSVQEHIIWGFQALADPAAIYVLIAELEGKHYHPAQMALIAIGIQARDALLAAKSQVRLEARERIDYVLEQITK